MSNYLQKAGIGSVRDVDFKGKFILNFKFRTAPPITTAVNYTEGFKEEAEILGGRDCTLRKEVANPIIVSEAIFFGSQRAYSINTPQK